MWLLCRLACLCNTECTGYVRFLINRCTNGEGLCHWMGKGTYKFKIRTSGSHFPWLNHSVKRLWYYLLWNLLLWKFNVLLKRKRNACILLLKAHPSITVWYKFWQGKMVMDWGREDFDDKKLTKWIIVSICKTAAREMFWIVKF